MYIRKNITRLLLYVVGFFLLLVLSIYPGTGFGPGEADGASTPLRRVNAPYFSNGVLFSETAVFWFGRVDNQDNYTDVRVGYDQDKLWIRTATADRRLWYNDQLNYNPNDADLPNWDAVTIYLDTSNDDAATPAADDYRFVSQLTWWEPQTNYQAAYRGNGANWVKIPYAIMAKSGWRGYEPNSNNDDRGWTMTYEIPFSALGLSGPPQKGSTWGLGVALHDRDTATGPPNPGETWPEQMNGQEPVTWGELVFGLPDYNPPVFPESGRVTIRHQLNGSIVTDAQVGGSTNCGGPFGPDYFDGWGDANYAGARQVNIQNLGDISDWPCFSKLYLTFPLDSVPANMAILSAQLTLHQFGGADVSLAKPSLIQVLTVDEPWDEETITWNNAPLATENVAATWAYVITDYPGWPGVPVSWDVSGAAASAYDNGSDLQIVLYESDWAYHSGKYFLSSEEEDLNAVARPTLELVWGQATEMQEITLMSGWNLISSYIQPSYPFFDSIFPPSVRESLILCKNNDGDIYWPRMGINEMDWQVDQAYQCFVQEPFSITLAGTPVNWEVPQELDKGWNMAAYWQDKEQPIDLILHPLDEDLVIAKTIDGRVYWPAHGVNQIGEMQPGQGYKLYLTNPRTLVYPGS